MLLSSPSGEVKSPNAQIETTMTLIPPVFSGTRVSEVSTPKTALAFYAGLLVIVVAAVAVAAGICATSSSLHYLVPWVLLFGAVSLVVIVGVVIWLNVKDPSKLQLGEVTSRDYVQIQQAKAIRGNSIGGEFKEAKPTGVPEDGGQPGADPNPSIGAAGSSTELSPPHGSAKDGS
jgi:hypothetical protein